MLTFVKYFISPAIVPLAGILLAIFVGYDWAHGPDRMINGHPDNAPWYASQALFVFCIFAYVPLLLVNIICLLIYRSKGTNLIISYIAAILICAFPLTLLAHDKLPIFGFSLILSTVFILPMAICSWAITYWQAKRSQNSKTQLP